jgi:hypothetical protein
MKVNEMVQIHEGRASVGGMFINEKFTTGTVVKVNKKSIRVHMTHVKCTTNGKLTREYDIDETATFAFWKTIENAGKTVDLYKNNKYGIIEIAH